MRPLVRLLLLIALVAAALWAMQAVDLARYLNQEAMRAVVDAHRPWGPVVFMAICMGGILMHMPELLIIALAAPALGPVATFFYGWASALVAATLTFCVVRFVARDHFQRVLVRRFPRLRHLDERLERNGFVTVLTLRLVLVFAPPLNWVLGATRVRLRDYVAATAIGTVPWVAAAAFFGEVLVPETPEDSWAAPHVVVAGALALVVLAAVGMAGRRLLGGVGAAPSA